MANICETYLYLIGDKKEVKNVKNKFKNTLHSSDFYENEVEEFNNECIIKVNMFIKHSFKSSYRETYDDFNLKEISKKNPSVKILALTLEPGFEFSENFLIKNGKVYIDEVNKFIVNIDPDTDERFFEIIPDYFIEDEEENFLYPDESYITDKLEKITF